MNKAAPNGIPLTAYLGIEPRDQDGPQRYPMLVEGAQLCSGIPESASLFRSRYAGYEPTVHYFNIPVATGRNLESQYRRVCCFRQPSQIILS